MAESFPAMPCGGNGASGPSSTSGVCGRNCDTKSSSVHLMAAVGAHDFGTFSGKCSGWSGSGLR
eukprot:CAMPEP_0119300526 /NCGR_PEP_ID=MMETSP1333-20130426/2456_1 /TAXON_ID=418940 /ORGANISM="Scyphosphaera apsteinii, Strain RCC1455" /LENGTH=63 /DNA_ID=CAMNT_0007302321 /DNA_START=569 /DNA_END=760 /DNA_ORIENTATION=-